MWNKKVFLTLIITFSSIAYFNLPIVALAQAGNVSNSVVTKVGNPSSPPPIGGAGSSNALVKAARDILTAYTRCAQGYSYTNALSCNQQVLRELGYSEDKVAAFGRRAIKASTSLGCAECLGFVGLSLTLITGDDAALMAPTAATYYNFSELRAGSLVFRRVPDNEPPQPGDIGVTIGGAGDVTISAGHILIVTNNRDNEPMFEAIESNYVARCKVTDGAVHPRRSYHLFRL